MNVPKQCSLPERTGSEPRERYIIVLVLGACFIVRVLFFISQVWRHHGLGFMWSGDSASYIRSTELLLAHGWYTPELGRPPGYAVFLALGVICGRVGLVTFVVQLGLSLVLVYLVYRVTRSIAGSAGGDNAALVAAAFCALDPQLVLYTSELMPEVCFTVLLLLSILLLFKSLERMEIPLTVASGIWLAFATFVKPISIYLPPFLGLCVALFQYRFGRKPVARSILCAVVFLLAAVIPPTAWTERNKVLFGLDEFSSISAWVEYDFIAAAITAKENGKPEQATRFEMHQKAHETCGGESAQELVWRNQWIRAQARVIINRGWRTFVPIYFKRLISNFVQPEFPQIRSISDNPERFDKGDGSVATLSSRPDRSQFQRIVRQLFRYAQHGYLLVVYLGIALAFYRARSFRILACSALVFLCGVYLIGMGSLVESIGRYRIPALPLFFVLTGIGWFGTARSRRRTRLADADLGNKANPLNRTMATGRRAAACAN